MSDLYEKHKEKLLKAREVIKSREEWAAYPEMPSEKHYGEGAKQKGEDDFNALLGGKYEFKVPMEGAEYVQCDATSPYGIDMSMQYPKLDKDTLLTRSEQAQKEWRKLDNDTRFGICMEILDRLSKQSFLMVHSIMHTTGQPYMMSFQAGSAHALERGLETIAYAANAMEASASTAKWDKVTGKDKEGNLVSVKMDKTFKTRGKGVGVMIGCATFPTWNGYPGLFASLSTGNSVIVKPADRAILPLAITVDIIREVLQESNVNPDVIQIAVANSDRAYTQDIVQDKRIKMIDFTGGTAFGDWLRENTNGVQLYLEQAGLNNILIESTDNFRAMTSNIAFSLSLYSGQMCTAPQNIYIPKDGIDTNDGHKSFDEVAGGIASAVEKLLGDDKRAFALLGALNSEDVDKRVNESANSDKTFVLGMQTVNYDAFPDAKTAKPQLIKVTQNDAEIYEEQFGPIAYVIATDDAQNALELVCNSIEQHGAMTTSLYSKEEEFKNKAMDDISDAGSPLSVNLTGMVYVNQSNAYSDFHGSGLNPAANVCLTDLGFVAPRFGWVTVREQTN
ncbi:phenylacetic acid degradation protein PaaN [Psychrobacter sp. LV10R520-6]|uniref:phenylacetic acid degradation protein PaaN n=1 Tax=Psychrobacter sp. LV10R520-6 TaxID=1415574 RepID=UPI0024C8433D|nr:phenylacetic acid degradation protein PaaN [Psychrobacter sp. LV10R520-6]SNT70607.1 phenylacetic acid degradation protein paaN [Psychrobacter sp. LV10R520-6]